MVSKVICIRISHLMVDSDDMNSPRNESVVWAIC